MIVERYMQRELTTVTPETSLGEVRRIMEEHGFGLLLVATEEGGLTGFVTRGALKEVSDWETPVERVCHPARFAVKPSDTLEKAALIMLENRLVLLPVTNEDRLIGVITQSEVLRGLAAGLGIGAEATRFTIPIAADGEAVYAVLEVLRQHGARLVSLTQGRRTDESAELIVRAQSIADKEALRHALERVLSGATV